VLSIKVERVPFSAARAGTDTLLVPRPGGYVIALAEDVKLSDPEKRVRVAHEIGHTLFYERPRQRGRAPTRSTPVTAGEEEFCHAFARDLLLPRESFGARTLRRSEVVTLAKRFGIPLPDAAIQASLIWDIPLAVGKWGALKDTRTPRTLSIDFSRHLDSLPVAATLCGAVVPRLAEAEQVLRPTIVVRLGHRTRQVRLTAVNGGLRPVFWG
jgi:hypothetical protein